MRATTASRPVGVKVANALVAVHGFLTDGQLQRRRPGMCVRGFERSDARRVMGAAQFVADAVHHGLLRNARYIGQTTGQQRDPT